MKSIVCAMLVLGIQFSDSIAQSQVRGSWTLRNGVDGGDVISVAAGDGVLLAGTRLHNIFRSLDSGKTWLPFPFGSKSPARVYFDPTARLFYGTSDSAVFTASPSATAWTLLVEGSTLEISADGATIILLNGQSEGVRVSRDAGKTWKAAAFPTIPTVGLNILNVLAADSCVYASDAGSPVSVSCDGGTTWRLTGGDSLSHYSYGMARHGNSVMAAAGRGLIRTLDKGKTWVPWAGNLPGEDRVWKLHQSGSSIFAWEQRKSFHRSRDGGISWSPLAPPFSGGTTSELPRELAELGGHLFTAASKVLLKSSDDAVSWKPMQFGRIQSPILFLGVNGNHYSTYTERGVFHSGDSGATWRMALPSDSASWRIGLPGDSTATWTAMAGAGGLYAAGSHRGQIRVSADSGATWSPSISLPTPDPLFSMAVLGRALYAATAEGLWQQPDRGGAWSGISLPAADVPRLLAAGSSSIFIVADSHIWELGDDGAFADRSAGIQPFQVMGLWTVEDRLYASTRNGYLFHWIVADMAWRRVEGFTGFVFSMVGSGSQMLLATSEGVYGSDNGGASWNPMGFGSTRDEEIRTLALSGGLAYGGDAKGGVWRFSHIFPISTTRTLQARGGKPEKVKVLGSHGVFRERNIRADGRRDAVFPR